MYYNYKLKEKEFKYDKVIVTWKGSQQNINKSIKIARYFDVF